MDTKAYMDEFKVRFAKLKSNREKIPLEQLTTRYAKAYGELVKWIEEYADWWAWEYMKCLSIPIKADDKAGNEWLVKKSQAIIEEERKPGGRFQRIRDALIEHLDEKEFENEVWLLQERLMKEAYDPYQQRFNRWIGKPGNRWIYNSLFDAYWLPKPEYEDGGYWIKQDRSYARMGYPPNIGPDPEGGKEDAGE